MPAATPGTPSLLRAMNDRAALDLLLTHGPLSRTRVGQLTGLSKPTASQLLARLEAAGLVVATGTDGGRPGPSAQLYAINPRAAYVGGVDVTPARVLAAVADLTGTVTASHEVPCTEGADAVALVAEALGGAVGAAGLHPRDLHRVVIGTPGAFDPRTGRLRYAGHLPGWHSPTLLDDLAAALPMPLAYENDVNLAAVAEQRLGAARGYGDFVLLWNEEGLGAALVFGGRLHRGWTGGAGEVGFLPVPGRPLIRQVARANSGGYQELAGVEGLPRLAAALGVEASAVPAPGAPQPPEARPATGTASGPHNPEVAAAVALLADAAAAPEGARLRFLQEYATALATGLASLVAVLDPEIVVLAGAAINAGGEPLRELLEAELTELAPARPRLVPGQVLDRPVLRGALESALAATRDEVFDTSR
ncbi:ROK family transcriptional regulator [Streptomyces sp. NPDC056254]|uniref:ROK family transcriptional regulator n=1 Tax=Streptomyces sp. NPDC056254 TaxID=3345763 RepID=UPI0035E29B46